MDLKRINSIIKNKQKCDVYYNERPVWIQETYSDKKTAKVGFIDNFEERNVYIEDLYEKNLYNN